MHLHEISRYLTGVAKSSPNLFHTRRLLQESAATFEELALFDQYRSENAKLEEHINTKFSPFTKRKFEIAESVRRVVSQKRRRHRGKGRRLCLDLFCGTCGISLALQQRGLFTECFDNTIPNIVLPGKRMRFNQLALSSKTNDDEICRRISSGVILFVCLFVCIAVPCSSFSILRVRNGTTSRSRQNPWGPRVLRRREAGQHFAASRPPSYTYLQSLKCILVVGKILLDLDFLIYRKFKE